MAGKSLYDKIWFDHVVEERAGLTLLYIDRHLIHEVTSPQAFEGLEKHQRQVRQRQRTLAVADHNTPTKNLDRIDDPASKLQLEVMAKNTSANNIRYFPLGDPNNGICHVVAPEQGFILPGATVVCGDSHTATHGAFGAIAFGIGTSEVEHVLATQTLNQKKMRSMRLWVSGELKPWVSAKDLILFIIGELGAAGGSGYAVEFAGPVIEELSMAGRMTVCNMAIEAGARIGLIAPDETTFSYLEGRSMVPKGEDWRQALASWRQLRSDADAHFDREIEIDASQIEPQITWGTSPEDVLSIGAAVPLASSASKQRALEYIGLQAGQKICGVPVDKVFLGSCTNSRIEDLRAAAKVVRGRKVAAELQLALVVPGSMQVKNQAEAEGLDKIFIAAGFEWRNPGCSMCLGMNDDRLQAGERCISTSNRNFEGRQGRLGRTHLASPYSVAAAAIKGCISDVRQLVLEEVK